MKKLLPALILTIGCFQMLGHLTSSRALRGLGLASGIAPYPKVFCETDGYEPFAAKFSYVGEDETGRTLSIPIDANRYAKLTGPYNRRNVYGAALAFAPRLPEELREHLFSKMSPLLDELDLPQLQSPRIVITPREGETITTYEYLLK